MNINRHNYEEFFILYMDNELGSEDRSRVEEFVAQNADLKEELELLLQSKFTPDTTITFHGKEELMKEPGSSFLTLSNYEEWLVMYIDNELTPAQLVEVEQFISLHPHVQKDLQLFRQTQAQPEAAIVFPDKQLLYRRAEKVRVISINWRRIAVAAILLLIAGSTTVVLLNKKSAIPEKGIADAPDNKQKTTPVTPINPVTNNNSQQTDQSSEVPEIANKVQPVNSQVKQNNNQEIVKRNNENVIPVEKQKQQNNIPKPEKDNTPVIARNDQKQSNDLPEPVNNPNVNNPSSITKDALGSVSLGDPADTENQKALLANNNKTVTKGFAHSSYNGTAQTTQSVDELDQSNSKKGKLRGFLRKVTRTFEKKTNINATDDDDRLLVGGLAIKLK